MQRLKNIYDRLTRRFGVLPTRIGLGVLCVVSLAVLFHVSTNGNTEIGLTEKTQKIVRMQSVAALSGNANTISLLGTVSAVREARLVAEAGGRVTAVYKKLGDFVPAGTIIATIENSTERASVLQAEGFYEAAKASAAVSDIGTVSATSAYDEAITRAQNTYRTAYTTADDVLRNTVDDVFSNPSPRMFGVKISGGSTLKIGAERLALEQTFAVWQESLKTLNTANGEALLTTAETYVRQLRSLTNTINDLLSDDDALGSEQAAELEILRTDFVNALKTLDATLQSISGARSALSATKAQKEQSTITGGTGIVSLADAQVKQALGALRLAQARLEKTIVRSPISGTLDTLTIKEGTSVAVGAPTAIISSTGGLEVVTYITEAEAGLIHVGDAVTFENDIEGVVTQIASAVDTVTKKIQVRVGIASDTSSLVNGQSVSLRIATESAVKVTSSETTLPITSFKMTPDGPIVFTVDDNGALVAHPVVLGAILGDTILVKSGLTPDMNIVTDARGLRAGELVTVE